MSAPTTDRAVVGEAVRTLAAEYCRALDSGRTDDLVALFTEDGSVELPGFGVRTGRDALRALYGSLTPQAPQLHLASNVVVTEVDGDRATATADLAFLLRGEAGWSVALVGGYHDVLHHEAGRWRFASRVMTVRD